MDKLESKLKELQGKYDTLEREYNVATSTVGRIALNKGDIEFEIKLIHDEMRRLSGVIDEDVKICLFEDLNRINQLYSVHKRRKGEEFTLELVYDESIQIPYKLEIELPSLYDWYIKITTKSKMICDVIRKCFSKGGGSCSGEESEISKMNATNWISSGYDCCTYFEYNADLAKSMLCPEFNEEKEHDEDRYSRRRCLDI
jgi:hypothetical protein